MKIHFAVALLAASVLAQNDKGNKDTDAKADDSSADTDDMTSNCKGVFQKFANASWNAKGIVSKVAVKSFPHGGEAQNTDVIKADDTNKVSMSVKHQTWCCNATVCSLRETNTLSTTDENGIPEGTGVNMLQNISWGGAGGLTVSQNTAKAASGKPQEEWADVMESDKVDGSLADLAKGNANPSEKVSAKGQKKNAFAARPVSTTWAADNKSVSFETVRLLRDAELPAAARLLTDAADNEASVGATVTTQYAYNSVVDGNVVASGASESHDIMIKSGAAALTAAFSLAALTMASF